MRPLPHVVDELDLTKHGLASVLHAVKLLHVEVLNVGYTTGKGGAWANMRAEGNHARMPNVSTQRIGVACR
jgi:hypothetical protein